MNIVMMLAEDSLQDMVMNASAAGHICYGLDRMHSLDGSLKYLQGLISKGHTSVLEHINLTFFCQNFSRALLQELARHRHISLSVESTRRTLNKHFTEEEELNCLNRIIADIVGKAGIAFVKNGTTCAERERIADALEELLPVTDHLDEGLNKIATFVRLIKEQYPTLSGVSQDLLKYFLPECYPTNFVMTLNLRELRHILTLRSASDALSEFRWFCGLLFHELPDWFRPLVSDCMNKDVLDAVKELEKEIEKHEKS